MTFFNKGQLSLKLVEELVQMRQYLHKHPEVSGEEIKTAAYIAKVLKKLIPDSLMTEIGGRGVLATYDSGRPGPALLFRAELDALPIQEVNTFSHRSIHPGIAHKCGHDGHMTILLGLAYWLNANRPHKGKVMLLFQPAEETGMGANAVLRDSRLGDFYPDFVFALHNMPGYPENEIMLKAGAFTAAVKSIIIKLYGKTSHAAEPEYGINPALAIAELVNGAHALVVSDVNRQDFALVTPIHITMGEKAYGVSAGYGEVHLTLRTWTEAGMLRLSDQLLALIQQVADHHFLKAEIGWTDSFTANENDEKAIELITQAAKQLRLPIREMTIPIKWGEDFGLFTQRFPGALFGLGAGNDTPALHNPDYDFPDALIATGVEMFSTLARQLLY